MFRKILIGCAAVLLAAAALASCEPSENVSSESTSEAFTSAVGAETSGTETDSRAESRPTEISLIESGDESDAGSFAESSEESVEISYPDPVFQGGEVQTPSNADNDLLAIRSITQSKTDELELFGDIDPDDAETAAALQQINDMLATYDKDIAFFAYSLDGTRAIAYNCEEEYFSACTIKAGYMLYCCLAIEQGLASADEVMYYQEKYYHGGSGRIKNSEYGTPYTLRELIQLSLSVSDNIAYKMLHAYFGTGGYNQMVEELGLPRLKLGSSIWNYKMTARDLSILWRELYFYFRTETPMAKLYKNSCTNTLYNYATIYLDEDYSHKSGDKFAPNPVYNDGAIVWKDMPYVLAVLNGSEGEAEDEKLVGTVVKIINDTIMKENDKVE